MPELPSASVTIDAASGSVAVGTDYLALLMPCTTNADLTPRVFVSSKSALAFHGYCAGVDYLAQHFEETGLPAIVVGMPIVTAGAISQQDDSQVDGTCAITITGTPVDEFDLELIVTRAGTAGTGPVDFDLSMDGGASYKSVKLGAAASYAVPYYGVTLAFAVGTLLVDDVYTCRGSAPKPDQAGIQAARTALAAQLKSERSWLPSWEVANSTEAGYLVTEVNAYETSNDRFKEVRIPVRDYYAAAKMSNVGTTTFAEVGASADTITRSAGSFIADGFRIGQTFTVTGSVSNNVTGVLAGVSATVLTLDTTDLVAEGPVAAGTVHITAAAEADPAWVSSLESGFASISDEPRVDLGAGRGRKLSRITGYRPRRSVQWAASVREYQHDVHIPTWAKEDGPLSGWDLADDDGNVVEHDERTDGGLLEAGFTCFRTWANGPTGTFIAKSVTRADPNSILSRTHNMAVVNVACSVVQASTERMIGLVLVLKADGTATESSLSDLETMVNTSLARALLQGGREGPRASDAEWTASRFDILNVPDATLNGTLRLDLNGTIEHVATVVRVNAGS